MDKRERLTLIQLALGKVSVDFMRQSKDVVMPTEALLKTAAQIEEIWAQEVAALESQLAQYRWRRVEEEIPEAFESVIVAGPDRRTEAFIDESGCWRWGGTANLIQEFIPTHWMPMPVAPEEGE